MAWFRLDDRGAFHRKVVKAGNEAYGAWTRAGQWSSGEGTEGHIPRDVALTIDPKVKVWERLVTAGLCEPHPEDGWFIHDFLDWNPTVDQVEKKRSARAEAGRIGGRRSAESRRAFGTGAEPAKADRARSELNLAIKRGDVQRGPCSICGADKAEGHHEDYSRPLDVVWLCKQHHEQRHVSIRSTNKAASNEAIASAVAQAKSNPDPDPDPVPKREQDPHSPHGGPADLVWATYVETLKRYRPRRRPGGLSPKDRKRIGELLKSGRTVDDLQAAVRGLFLSPFHLGQNDRATEYLALEYALRKPEDMAALADTADPEPTQGSDGLPPDEGYVDPSLIDAWERDMFGGEGAA